jgi:hypothetical protein
MNEGSQNEQQDLDEKFMGMALDEGRKVVER